MRYAALLAAFVVLLSATVVGSATAATDTQPALSPGVADRPVSSLSSPTDRSPALAVGAPGTNFTIALRDDGSARWTVETRIPLEDESDRAAFREYARSYEDGDADGGPSVDLFRNAAVQASEATGREMAVGQVNRTATLHNGSGTLTLRFTWSGFLAPGENGALVLGDAFETPGNGTWFGSLSAAQRLVIVPPENYEVSDVSDGFRRSIDDRRIVVEGPQTFEAGDIGIAYAPTTTGSQLPVEWIVGGGALLVVVVAVVAYRRGGLSAADSVVPGVTASGVDESGTGADGGIDPDAGTVAGSDTESDGSAPGSGADPREDSGVVAGDAAGAGSAAAVAGDGPDAEEDLELLSDEERVERLLEQNGGRMRQGDIVGGTGWSDAKVSQLLSAMADDGRIEKLRLGRENLISLADEADADGDEDNDGARGSGGGHAAGDEPDR